MIQQEKENLKSNFWKKKNHLIYILSWVYKQLIIAVCVAMTQTEKITGLKGAYLGKNKQFSWHSSAAAVPVSQCSKILINVKLF